MTTDRERDQMRAALAAMSENAVTRDDCPQPAVIWAAVLGKLAAKEVRAVVDHTASCLVCAEAWELADELDDGSTEDSDVHLEEPPSRAFRWPGAAAAAAVLILMIAAPWRESAQRSRDSTFRNAESPGFHSLVSEDEPLSRRNCVLRWSLPGGEGARFNVLVTTDSAQLVAERRDLEVPEFPIPEQALVGLPPGAKLLWRVEAVLSNGSSLSTGTMIHVLE